MTLRIIAIISLSLVLTSCLKEEYLISEDILVDDLHPTFGVPIGFADITLGDLEQNLDTADIIDNTSGQVLAVVFEEEVARFTLDDLLDLPDQEAEGEFEADALTAALINTGQAGTEIPLPFNVDLPFDFTNGEQLDSIRLQEATLSITVNSTFRHFISAEFIIADMSLNGVPFTGTAELNYQGTVPFSTTVNFDVSDYLLDFSGSGTNSLDIDVLFTVTHSGEFTAVGDMLDFELLLSSNSIDYAYGYLGQYTGLSETNTQEVSIFQDIADGEFYFDDPQLEFDFYNTSGIPLGLTVSSIYDPNSGNPVTISGGGLNDIPVIAAAGMPGETAHTFHRIDNNNLDPNLSDLLTSGPFELTYTAEAMTNPDGFSQNWVEDTSTVRMNARLILPFSGYAYGYVFADTISSELGQDLDLSIDSAGTLSTEDIEQVVFRIISDNGLPLDLETQLYFLDPNLQVVDSLFDAPGSQNLLLSGNVDHGLPIGHQDQGRVLSPTRTITEIPVDADRLQNIIDSDVKSIAIRATGSTDEAQNGEIVKFYPEYILNIQLAARIETNIDLSE